jgi:hypothetical protein
MVRRRAADGNGNTACTAGASDNGMSDVEVCGQM